MARLKIIIDMLYLDPKAEEVLGWVVNTLGADPELEIELLDLKEWFIPRNEGAGVALIQKGAAEQERNRARFTPADCLVLLLPQEARAGLMAPFLAEFAPLWPGLPALLISYGAAGSDPADAALTALLRRHGLRPSPGILHWQIAPIGRGDLRLDLTVTESLRHLGPALCTAVGGRLAAGNTHLL